MKNSTIIVMTVAVVLAALLLVVINLLPIFSNPAKQTYIALNNVKGSEVVYQQKPYTLNFDQQNEVIDILNRAVFVKKSDYPQIQNTFTFDKIIIYPFSGNTIEIKPIALADRNIVFSASEWSLEYYLMELSAGSLQEILKSAHD